MFEPFQIVITNDGTCVVITETEQKTIAYVYDSIFLENMSITHNSVPLQEMGGECHEIYTGSESKIVLIGGLPKIIEGEELEKLLDPLSGKSILELAEAIKQKLNERKGETNAKS